MSAESDERALPVILRLYIGPFLNARSRAWLLRHEVTHVLNATKNASCLFEAELTYLRVPIDDNPTVKIEEHFEASNAFIARALADGGTVLVHCHMGRSRSATLIAAYLMAEHGHSMQEAFNAVRAARPCIAPNTGFIKALWRYESQLAAARRCSCHELRQRRCDDDGLRCSVCDSTSVGTSVGPSGGSEDGSDGASGGTTSAIASTPPGARFDAFDLLLASEPAIDEVAFVPGPLHAGLFEGHDADGGVRVVPLPPLKVGIICAARKVAIDVAALPKLLADCRAAWASSRMAWLSVCAPAAETAAETAAAQRGALAQQLARSSRALLLLTGGQSYTAWADRRRLLCAGWLHRDRVPQRSEGPTTEVDATAYEEELRFAALVLRSFAKSNET